MWEPVIVIGLAMPTPAAIARVAYHKGRDMTANHPGAPPNIKWVPDFSSNFAVWGNHRSVDNRTTKSSGRPGAQTLDVESVKLCPLLHSWCDGVQCDHQSNPQILSCHQCQPLPPTWRGPRACTEYTCPTTLRFHMLCPPNDR